MSLFNPPPPLIERLLRWTLPDELKEPILGDLAEEFQQRHLSNSSKAHSWYIRQALKTSNQFIWHTKRGFVMFSLSIVVFTAVSLMAFWFGSEDFGLFIDIPSLLLIFPPALFFALAATSVKDMKNGLKSLINDELDLSQLELTHAKQFFDVMGNSALLMGFFTTFIGAIAMASHISADAFNEVFGPAFAVCVLVLMYSFGLKTLCYVAAQKIQYKRNYAE